MAEQVRPTILSPNHIQRAIGDDRFYLMLPEFLTIKKKLQAMHTNVGAGCKPCQKRRAASSLSSDFVSIMNRLSDDGLRRIKKYLGVPRLIVRAVDRSTGRIVGKEV